jgi:predicted dehydrogenase
MYEALIIGCGNIGAMYDFENESILTYAKAFHIDPEINFSVYDTNHLMAEKVAQRYSVQALQKLEPEAFGEYDIVAICTPTPSHYDYLCKMLMCGPKLVICEKPVDSDLVRLDNILSLYRKSNTKVMVNFFRRFQPGIIQLKKEISDLITEERCTNIVVSYQRGFHNNASHAIDLLEFLFGVTFDLSAAQITHTASDEFDTDPTMSVSCFWNDVIVQFVGLAHVEFSHFDIAIYFTRKALLLKDGSNEIEWLTITPKSGNFYPKLKLQSKRTGVVESYMENVILHAKLLLNDNELISNFLESISISQRILKLQGK